MHQPESAARRGSSPDVVFSRQVLGPQSFFGKVGVSYENVKNSIFTRKTLIQPTQPNCHRVEWLIVGLSLVAWMIII